VQARAAARPSSSDVAQAVVPTALAAAGLWMCRDGVQAVLTNVLVPGGRASAPMTGLEGAAIALLGLCLAAFAVWFSFHGDLRSE
jgi:hypothetical protein